MGMIFGSSYADEADAVALLGYGPRDCATCGHAINLHEQDDETGTERVLAGCCKGTCQCSAFVAQVKP